MPYYRALYLLLAASAVTAAACAETPKTIIEPAANEPVAGIPDECFIRRAAAAPAANDSGLPVAPPPALPIRCANDSECGAGARCNSALSPPHCVTLYCIPEQGACSSAEQCLEGLQCHKGTCNPCNLCGSLCEVDFLSDPKNCGGCGKKIAPVQKCVEGEATCPADRPTLCGDECVDTRTDPRHCGACDKAIPAGGTCTKGKSACAGDGELEVCGGTCVDTKTNDAHCGACGHVCPSDLECNSGYCYKSLSSVSPQQTCNTICQNAGLRCGAAAAVFTASASSSKVVDVGCGALAGTPPAGYVFNSMSCACVER